MKFTQILIFGDSIPQGCQRVAGWTWADLLRSALQEKIDDKNLTFVLPLGIPGETTDRLRARFRGEFLARADDRNWRKVVIFASGLNDTKTIRGENFVPLGETVENVAAAVRDARDAGADEIFWVGLTRVGPVVDDGPLWSNAEIEKYELAIRAAAEAAGARWISLENCGDPRDFPDGAHPGPAGHREIFEKISAALGL